MTQDFHIESDQQIITFFQILLFKENIRFHPDKKFEEYIETDSGLRKYNDSQVNLREGYLLACRRYCSENGIDIYSLWRKLCTLDIEEKLREYFPMLFKLLGENSIDWKSINKKFEKVFEKRLANYEKGITKVDANFYDIISESLKGGKSAKRMVGYFSKLMEELDELLQEDKLKIKDTLYNLLMEFDLNYLNYVGELSVLNYFLQSGKYVFKSVEAPLGNENSADFLFDVKHGEESVLIEVVNIRPEKLPETDEYLRMLIRGKLNDKINKKTKGSSEYLKFYLAPVFWGSVVELKRVANLFLNGDRLGIPNAMEIFAYCTFSDLEDETRQHRFGVLSTLFME